MSWQPYVDHAVASGMATGGGIYDPHGNPWAYSPGFHAQPSEIAAVCAHWSVPAVLAATGAFVNGVHYSYAASIPDEEIYMRRGATGVCFCRCATCVIVGFHDGSMVPFACRHALRQLAKYLRKGEELERAAAAQPWQPYIDHAVESRIVTAGGIYDLQGCLWATSAGFHATSAEVAAVIAHFDSPAALAHSGGVVGGTHYAYGGGEPGAEIYLARDGGEGLTFRRCATCVVVGQHDSSIVPSACRSAVRKLAERYLTPS